MIDLKPCPFCGSKDSSIVPCMGTSPHFSDWFVAMCNECGAELEDRQTYEEAAAAWNSRAPVRVSRELDAGVAKCARRFLNAYRVYRTKVAEREIVRNERTISGAIRWAGITGVAEEKLDAALKAKEPDQ